MTAQSLSLVDRVSRVIFARAKALLNTLALLKKALFKKKTSFLQCKTLYDDGSDFSESSPIDITASLQHIRLSLGTSSTIQSTGNPRLHLRDVVEEYVDINRPIKVTATLEAEQWPPEQGLRRLGEWLAYIGDSEVDFKFWTELNVRFPTDEPLYFTANSDSLLSSNALASLKRLTWSAHREQLIDSWLPFTPSLLGNLTNLDMCSDLSLFDFSYILDQGSQLKNLTVRTLRKDLLYCPVLPRLELDAPNATLLESLTLRFDDDLVVPFLALCKFPSLRHLDLDICYPTISNFTSLKSWSNLETISISGNLTQQLVEWIGSQCSLACITPGLAVFHTVTDVKM